MYIVPSLDSRGRMRSLEALATKWRAVVTKARLVPGGGDDWHTAGAPRATGSRVRTGPRPAANASSIAFVLEQTGKRVLSGADAHADVLTAKLRRYSERVKEARPRFELVKLPHHVSNANISMEMLDLIDRRRWLVSTNGDNHAHPDDAAISEVIRSAAAPVTFCCNYRTPRTAPWAERRPAVGAMFEFPIAGLRSLRVAV